MHCYRYAVDCFQATAAATRMPGFRCYDGDAAMFVYTRFAAYAAKRLLRCYVICR